MNKTISTLLVGGLLLGGTQLTLPQPLLATNPDSCVFARNLSIGLNGGDVLNLQRTLNASADTRVAINGAGSPNNETSYFGPATAAAVTKFQAKNKLVPTGTANVETRSKLSSECKKLLTVKDSTQTDKEKKSLSSKKSTDEGDFRIKNKSNSQIELGLSDTDTIAELELDAKGSEMTIDRIDLVFNQKPERYFKSLNLELDNETIAKVDVTKKSYDKVNKEYRIRINLKNVSVKKNDKESLSVTVNTLKSIKSNDLTRDLQLKIYANAIRITDSTKLSTTLPDKAFNPINITFSKTRNVGELKVINHNADRTVVVKQNQINKDIVLNQFNLTGKKQDIELREIYTQINLFDLDKSAVRKLSLYVDGKLIDTQTLETTLFDINIKGDSGNYVVIPADSNFVKFNLSKLKLSDTAVADFQIRAELNKDLNLSNYSAIEVIVRDIRGKDINNKEVIMSGLNLGRNHETFLVNTGLKVESDNITKSSKVIGRNNISVEYRMTIPVTALETDVVINPNAATTFSYYLSDSSGNIVEVGSNVSAVIDSNARQNSLGNYIINEGQTKNLELVVAFTKGDLATGFYQLVLTEINYQDNKGNIGKALIRKNNRSDYVYLN